MYKFFEDYDKATKCADLLGGWVLVDNTMGMFGFVVCDDPGTIKDIRGQDFIDECERQQRWDETLLQEPASPA